MTLADRRPPIGILIQEGVAVVAKDSGERFGYDSAPHVTKQPRLHAVVSDDCVVDRLRKAIGPKRTIVFEYGMELLDGSRFRPIQELAYKDLIERPGSHCPRDRLSGWKPQPPTANEISFRERRDDEVCHIGGQLPKREHD